MPSFDIVSKLDPQTLDNAINTAKKEILNRFDFRDSQSEIELDKKGFHHPAVFRERDAAEIDGGCNYYPDGKTRLRCQIAGPVGSALSFRQTGEKRY